MSDGEEGTTVTLAEFRYVASRHSSTERADAHIDDFRDEPV